MSNYSTLDKRGSAAIELCMTEYVKLKGDALPKEIDRAYVHAGQNLLGVLFVRGEMGTFGERDAFYRSFISCGVLLEPEMHIQDVREGYSILKGEDVTSDDSDFYKGHVDELLYLREGKEFTFSKGQVFSSERIDALKFPAGS